MPFLTARACYETKIKHGAWLPTARLKSLTDSLKRHYRAFTMHTWFPLKQNRKHLPPFASRNPCGRTMCSPLSGTRKSTLSKSQTLMTSCTTYTASKASPMLTRRVFWNSSICSLDMPTRKSTKRQKFYVVVGNFKVFDKIFTVDFCFSLCCKRKRKAKISSFDEEDGRQNDIEKPSV